MMASTGNYFIKYKGDTSALSSAIYSETEIKKKLIIAMNLILVLW